MSGHVPITRKRQKISHCISVYTRVKMKYFESVATCVLNVKKRYCRVGNAGLQLIRILHTGANCPGDTTDMGLY